VLGEMPNVMARSLVPRLRVLTLCSSSQTICYLTPLNVMLRFATCFVRRNRLVNEQTGEITSSSLSLAQRLSDCLVQ
jgi:hypothetical protein